MDRVKALLDARRLERDEAPDAEIVGLWRNALRVHESAYSLLNDPGTRVTLAYDSGRIAATAIVRSHGLRVRAANHHEAAITTARLLTEGDLAGAFDALNLIRPLRVELEYGWQRAATAAEARHTLQVVRTILQLGAAYLHERLPRLRESIALPEG